jgi:hypothetical protein
MQLMSAFIDLAKTGHEYSGFFPALMHSLWHLPAGLSNVAFW